MQRDGGKQVLHGTSNEAQSRKMGNLRAQTGKWRQPDCE